MITEIITIGDELLIGKVTNTNFRYLAKEVSNLGLNCLYQTTVGDNADRIKDIIKIALERSNLLIITGGLGPTADDITIETLASYFNTDLEFKPKIASHIDKHFKNRNLEMPKSNLKQACIPTGAIVIDNPVGTAPGILWDVTKLVNSSQKKLIMTFPGIPQEMELMWQQTAKPILKEYSTKVLYEKYINFIGISESALIEVLSEFMLYKDPIVLPYANNFVVQLRVFSEKYDIKLAKEKVEQTVSKIKEFVAEYIYGYDDETLEGAVAQLLVDQNKTVAIAESCTGGLISSRLTDISGSSKFIKFNLITYSNESKISQLNVPPEIIEQYGSVSEATTSIMAKNIREMANTDIGIATSGIAGPTGGSEEKPVGTIYIAISDSNKTLVFKNNTTHSLSRTQIKFRFSQLALNLMRRYLLSIL